MGSMAHVYASLVASIIAFVGGVGVHVIIHRSLARWGIGTVKTIIVYGVGLVVLAAVVWPLPFPLTAIAFYSLLVAAHFLFFFSFYFEGESPSAQLMRILKIHGPLKESEFYRYFSDELLFGKRLEMLARAGYIRKKGSRYKIMKKGKVVAAFFEKYRKLLRWDMGGL